MEEIKEIGIEDIHPPRFYRNYYCQDCKFTRNITNGIYIGFDTDDTCLFCGLKIQDRPIQTQEGWFETPALSLCSDDMKSIRNPTL